MYLCRTINSSLADILKGIRSVIVQLIVFYVALISITYGEQLEQMRRLSIFLCGGVLQSVCLAIFSVINIILDTK